MEHGGQWGQGGKGGQGEQGDRGDRGQGARENRERERNLFEGGKREQKLKLKKKFKNYFIIVYNRLSSSFRTSSYLTSTDALKILS